MKKSILFVLIAVMLCTCLWGCSKKTYDFVSGDEIIFEGSNVNTNASLRNSSGKKVSVSVDGKSFTIDLYDNATANDFYDKLPITITANDYSGYDEKVCRLGETSLSMENAPDGDNPLIPEVGYYEPGNWIALYYGYIGYWTGKVPLGTIDADTEELESISDDSEITFEAIIDNESTSEKTTTAKSTSKSENNAKTTTAESTNKNENSTKTAAKSEAVTTITSAESVSKSTTTNSPIKEESEEKTENMKNNLDTAVYNINGVNVKMILVEGGTFTMGSDNSDVQFSESPAHTVTISKDYLIGETEVTEALWNAVMRNSGGSDILPKTSVTWQQTHNFIDKLNVFAHKQGIISESQNFKLPTEAEWEFAAKGGNQSKGYLYSGSDNIDDVAVTRENSGSSSPISVKTKQPNELGIYDMSGNAYEWVDDYGGAYSSDEKTDPQNTTKSNSYVKRGGSNYHGFSSEPYLFTTTGRYFYVSTDWTIGFRIALG